MLKYFNYENWKGYPSKPGELIDIKLLRNCKILNVIPKFLSFNLPYTNEVDSKFIRKRLLRSALNKRQD